MGLVEDDCVLWCCSLQRLMSICVHETGIEGNVADNTKTSLKCFPLYMYLALGEAFLLLGSSTEANPCALWWNPISLVRICYHDTHIIDVWSSVTIASSTVGTRTEISPWWEKQNNQYWCCAWIWFWGVSTILGILPPFYLVYGCMQRSPRSYSAKPPSDVSVTQCPKHTGI